MNNLITSLLRFFGEENRDWRGNLLPDIKDYNFFYYKINNKFASSITIWKNYKVSYTLDTFKHLRKKESKNDTPRSIR